MTEIANPAAAGFERRAATVSVVVSVVLTLIKFAAYYATGSSAIFSDALESIVNVAASCFALYSVILAHLPADAKHPYGHGKIEFLSAFFEGGMILLAALVIVARTIDAMIHGPAIEKISWGVGLIILAMIVNGLIGWYLIRSGRKHGSIALVADGKHLLSDAVTSAAVLVALLIVMLKPAWIYVDPIAALLVAGYITWLAIDLLRPAAAGLMDQQDVEDDKLLTNILDSHVGPSAKAPQICSYHKLRHRHSGRYHWVDFHIMVPADWSIDKGHQVASSIEYEIENALGEGNATAHVEPCVDQQCGTCGRGEKPEARSQ
jgi:cation diffusion facilitator family transporter